MSEAMRPEGALTRSIVYWAAAECQKQRSGELSVAWMLDGWAYAAARRRGVPSFNDILWLGKTVEPTKNERGTRRTEVTVNGNLMPSPGLVDKSLRQLVEGWTRLSAKEWFRQFEEIHPFRDGNGRVGSILFNWHRGVLLRPTEPPDLWSQPASPITDYGEAWVPAASAKAMMESRRAARGAGNDDQTTQPQGDSAPGA